jgi:hypothetical protein
MAHVIVEGQFLGVNLKKTSFEGKEKTNVYLDLYQPEVPDTNKNVQIKAEDIIVLNSFKDAKMGQPVKALCSVNAYQNQAYYKLVTLL